MKKGVFEPLSPEILAEMEALAALPDGTITAEAILERGRLQKILAADVSPLGDDLMVLAEEYGN